MVCGKPANQACSQCTLFYYCDQTHQKQHWQAGRHKHFCKMPNHAETYALDVLRSLIRDVSCSETFGARAIAEAKQVYLLLYQETLKWPLLLSELATMVALGYFLCGYWESDWWEAARCFYPQNTSSLVHCLPRCFPTNTDGTKLSWKDSVQKWNEERARLMQLDDEFKVVNMVNKQTDLGTATKTRPRMFALFVPTYDMHAHKRVENGCAYYRDAIAQSGTDVHSHLDVHVCSAGIGIHLKQDKGSKKVLFSERSLLIGNALPEQTCFHCTSALKPGKETTVPCRKNCGFLYCSSLCESRSWKQYHEHLCSLAFYTLFRDLCVRLLKVTTESTTGATPSWVLQLKLIGMALRLYTPDALFRKAPFCFMSRFQGALQDHYAFYLMYQSLMIIAKREDELADDVRQRLPLFNSQWLLTAQSILVQNTITVNPQDGALMIGHLFHLLNHSCDPNTTIVERNGHAIVVSRREIRSHEPLTVLYSDNHDVLRDVYDIHCTCNQQKDEKATLE